MSEYTQEQLDKARMVRDAVKEAAEAMGDDNITAEDIQQGFENLKETDPELMNGLDEATVQKLSHTLSVETGNAPDVERVELEEEHSIVFGD
tara:strand:+ start:299 stop:574 length:276 start_codon:yes stop_codon:yes gene_type:complete